MPRDLKDSELAMAPEVVRTYNNAQRTCAMLFAPENCLPNTYVGPLPAIDNTYFLSAPAATTANLPVGSNIFITETPPAAITSRNDDDMSQAES